MSEPQPIVLDVSSGDKGVVGQLIAGRYLIRELIGRGGVGVVYLATDTESETDVVVKFLGLHWAGDQDAAARFEREARRLGSLEHPNIVKLLDCGHDSGRAYLVMEYVQGRPLSERLRDRSNLTVQEFVPIAAQILKGVGHAHSRSVVLRDIKASNVMLCHRKGRADFVVLLDFGLAKRLHDDDPITREYLMGTAGYIAPEALSGGTTGLGVDVYALGVLFWYMLVGSMPFEADDDSAVFYKTVHESVPSLDAAMGGSTIPAALASLVEECLAKDPEERPRDANEIVERLIDAVPVRLFRLPRTPGSIPARAGEGNTGMIALTGFNPTGKYVSIDASASSSAAVLEAAPAAKPESRAWAVTSVVAGVAVLALLGVVAYLAMARVEPPPQTAAVAPSAETPNPVVASTASSTSTKAANGQSSTTVQRSAPPPPPTPSPDEAQAPELAAVAPPGSKRSRSGRASKRRRSSARERDPEPVVEEPPPTEAAAAEVEPPTPQESEPEPPPEAVLPEEPPKPSPLATADDRSDADRSVFLDADRPKERPSLMSAD